MPKLLCVFFILALAGCSGAPPRPPTASPCATSEVSYQCQIERYQNVNAQ